MHHLHMIHSYSALCQLRMYEFYVLSASYACLNLMRPYVSYARFEFQFHMFKYCADLYQLRTDIPNCFQKQKKNNIALGDDWEFSFQLKVALSLLRCTVPRKASLILPV